MSTDTITYSIPVSLAETYRGQKTIIRASDPSEIMTKFSDAVPDGLCHIRLLSLDGAVEDLKGWFPGIPIELVIRDTCRDLPALYRCSPLLATHPLRVSVPLVPGFGAVVKLGTSLNIPVKVEGAQPDKEMFGELLEIARYYLHRTTVTEPIEFFHSLFLAFYHRNQVTLWAIQEEEPLLFRYITGRGNEMNCGRLAERETDHEFSVFSRELHDEIASGQGECAGCEFLMNCLGYFKWPRREYRCDGVKALMNTLKEAADELRRNVASFRSRKEGESS
jgi:hypothetical protein